MLLPGAVLATESSGPNACNAAWKRSALDCPFGAGLLWPGAFFWDVETADELRFPLPFFSVTGHLIEGGQRPRMICVQPSRTSI